MISKLRCMFVEDFTGEENSEKLELEHSRLRTVFSLTGNLMIALLVFALFFMSIFEVSAYYAAAFFLLWTSIFLGVLAAFEKMFKDIEKTV